jgi:hypothetical protein
MSTAMQFTNPIGARTNHDDEEGDEERGGPNERRIEMNKDEKRENDAQSNGRNLEDGVRRRCTCGHEP